MLINELRKRPFARPLFLWIAGICLAILLPAKWWVFLFIGMSVLILLFSLKHTKEEPRGYRFAARGMWGVVFALLLVSTAGIVTDLAAARHLSPPVTENRLVKGADSLRERLSGKWDRLDLSQDERSVLATLTLGDRRKMDRNVRKRFSAAGVSHILAVSGFHVAVVCGFLSGLFVFFRPYGPTRWVKYAGMLVLLWGYVVVTGLAASAVRAGVMLSVYLVARLSGLPADRYNTLAVSAFGMLVYDPFYLLDVGFQLSYSAVFFILYFQPRLLRLIRVRNPLLAMPWQGLTVTVAAQTGTTFLCLYYFGEVSLVFLFTNLPVAFLSLFLIPAGLLFLFLPAWLPGYGWLGEGVEWGIHGLMGMVDVFGRMPGATYTLPFSGFDAIAGYGMLLFGMMYLCDRRFWQLFASLGILLIMLIARLIARFLLAGI